MKHYYELTPSQYNSLTDEDKTCAAFADNVRASQTPTKYLGVSKKSLSKGTEITLQEAQQLIIDWQVVKAADLESQ